jgi:hypothetical protein
MNESITQSNLATIKHIHAVREILHGMIEELDHRAQVHDASKLQSPEQEVFGANYEKLNQTKYDSPEYKQLLEEVKPAIEHHYAKNRHHPEHWKNGVNDMTLIDMLEMLADWKAATKRNKNGNIRQSIEHNAKRFGMSPQLKMIFENTVREIFKD